MRFLLPLVLAGCSHVTVDGGKAQVESRSLAAIVVAGMFIAAAGEEAREPRPFPNLSELADWFRAPPRAELDPTRPVSEQDCTRPVELGGNLRCR
jgi:hypothetical protein